MLNFTHVTEGRALSVIGPLSFMRPLYLHGRQRSKVHVQICVNALMLYSWPSAFQLAWTGTSPCLWFSKTGWSRIQDVDWFKCCTFKDDYKNKWIWWKKMDSMVYLACVFRFFSRVSACQMGVFLFWLKESHSERCKIAILLASSWSVWPPHSNIN